jgi:ferritin
MNLSPGLLAALNAQYAQELSNYLMYLQLAAPLEAGNVYLGCASFLKKSGVEELDHAKLFYDYINDRNEQAIPSILAVPAISPMDNLGGVFELALEAEVANSARLLTLFDQADTPTKIFLQSIIMEQVSSERELTEIISRLDEADGDMAALLEIDRQLGKA